MISRFKSFYTKQSFLLPFFLLPLALMFFGACSEKETDLGIELQDPATFYDGKCDTAYGVACTVFDDSLVTSGWSSLLLGCYSDDVFGQSEAILYTQVCSPNDEGVAFDQYCRIDSVVLSLAISEIYGSIPSSKGYRDLHFEVYQLAEGLMTDSTYYADDELAVSSHCLFNGVVRQEETDTMVVDLKLNNSIISLLDNKTYATADDFKDAMKGLRIRLVNDGTPQMATVNLAAAATRMTVYYAYQNEEESIYRTYEFAIGHTVTHFNQYKNHYTGLLSTFNSNHADSLNGNRYLYLSPMGGTNVKLNFNDFIQQFKAAHPYAVIHYAELLLPVSDIAMNEKPAQIAALKYYSNGTVVNIPDMYDAYTYQGFDGTYDADKGYYRLRITQHLQQLIRNGVDYGTLLILNGRRSSAAHTVLNGYDANVTSNNPVRIQFIYSE